MDQPPAVSCAWPAVVSPTRLNFAFPETNATYWLMPYQLGDGDRLVVEGTFPFARFSSLTTYNATGSDVDSLSDGQITPNPGSTNPATDPDASTDPARRRYRVTVQPGVAVGSGANVLAATTGSATSGSGYLALRIYVPTDKAAFTGGVPLPALSVRESDGQVRALKTCPDAGSRRGPDGPLAEELEHLVATQSVPGGFEGCGTSTPDAPKLALPNKVGGLFPNPYNKYLCTPIAYEPGRVAVIRGQAPTFPNTTEGQSVLTKSQLRYWSLCQNQWRLPYPVRSCAADYQTALDENDRYTYVVSTPQDRPANATADNGVTWIPWGRTDVPGVLIFRNMLPASDFPNAIQNVQPGENPAEVMGSYYPTVTYCTKAEFTKSGPTACPAR
ncbi:hypothetical protein ACWCXB_01690 [Streptomyces sp. NPDC001514]